MFQSRFMIEKRWPDILALAITLYDLSVSRNLFSKDEMRQFGATGTEGLTLNGNYTTKLIIKTNSKIKTIRY